MKKENFVTLLLSTVGGILFALGMCMGLIFEWNTFNEGIIVGVIGIVVLLAMVIVRRKMLNKPPVKLTGKTVATIALVIIGALCFGIGLCMTMVWEGLMVWGIVVGLVGIILLLCLIPLCKGLK